MITKDIKLKTEESSSSNAGQSRPVSICSSVSSGYASGEEGDTSTPLQCPCNGPTCNAKHQEFSRIVKELRHESALEQLARQKFDFSVSCISPTLQRLQALKREKADIPESGEKTEGNHKAPGEKESVNNTTDQNKQKDSTVKDDEITEHPKEHDVSKIVDNDNIEQTMDNFIEDFSTTLSNIENLHLMNLLSAQRPVLTRRSFSDGLPLSDQASCDYERDLGYHSPLEETPLSSQSTSNFQRFRKNRRSWAPQSSLSKQYADCISTTPSAVGVQYDDDDNVSIWSGLSTLSGESVMSGVSAMSLPVDGKHASKKRYFKLKDFFKQLRGTKQRRYV